MKRILLLALVLIGIIGNTSSQNVFDPEDAIVRYSASAAYGSAQKPDTTVNGLQKWVSVSTNGVSSGSGSYNASSFKAYFMNYFNVKLSFRLKFPKSYSNPDSAGKKYPVMLFLHGAGEVACASNGGIYNNEKQLVLGGKTFMQRVDNNQFDGFLFYPQYRSKDAGCWGEWASDIGTYNTIITILDSLVKYTRLDIDRVFADGLSGGAVGVWRLMENFPTRIAKAAPTSAAGLAVGILNYGNFVHIPIWLATGGKDTSPSPAMAQYTDSVFNRVLGGSLRRSLYPDLGHSSWDRHWAEPDFVPFMNDVHKANPLIFFNRFEFCPDSAVNVKLGITTGFNAYEWEKDGVLIARRTGNTNTIVNGASIISYAGNEITVRSFGTYRVRFRRTSTSDWSEWSPKPAVIQPKTITQTPPIQVVGLQSKTLPSLDGKNSVQLQMPPDFLNYQWIRTSDNVQVSTAQIYDAPVGTYKARYSEPYGCGTLYSPDFKVVNASGTPKPDPAKNLNVIALSQSVLRLDWSDNPNASFNETGFEIYRGTKETGPFSLVKITAPDVSSFQDSSLTPNATYYYVVRAVTESGAAASSNVANGKTEVDDVPPTAPSGLEYRGSTSTSVTLRWKAATDNVAINRYDIFANGAKLYSTTGLSFIVANLDSLTTYSFVVKAIDKAGNTSPASNQVIGFTHRQGLNYKYYHGSYSNLPNFSNLTPVKTGVMDTVNAGAGVRTQEDNYAFLWEGKVYIPVSGTWTFETASDDGSKLYIDVPYGFNTTALVSNDGAHGVTSKTGSKYLEAGYHIIAITFAEVSSGEEMNLYWSNNVGLARERIPKGFFSIGDDFTSTATIAPSALIATAAAYNKITLTWADNSTDETGFEIVRSTTANGTYQQIFTTAANATSYTDSGLNASTRYFYKIRSIGALGASDFVALSAEANWKFNNNYSEDAGGPSLTNSNTAFSSTDKAEGSHAVVFSNNDYISMGGNSTTFPSMGGYNQRTIALWIKPSSTTGKRIIYEIGGSDNGIGLRMNNNALEAGIASGSTLRTITLSNYASNANWLSGQWNHVSVVYDVNKLTLYINGTSVASNTSLPFTTIGNSSNASRIGAASGTGSGVVFNDSQYSTYLGSMDNMYVIKGALTKAQIDVLRTTNVFQSSSATTPAAPAPPAAPGNVVALAKSTNTIELTWNDNSLDETGFEIWRASGDKSNNRKIATIGGDNGAQKIFKDSTLFANVTYYYKVRAIGLGGNSAYAAEVSAKTLNTKPFLNKVLDFSMKYGTSYSLPISATDVDGDQLTFTTQGLPVFASLQNMVNGNMNIVFAPSITKRGAYIISIFVSDGNGGKDTSTFTLLVNTNDVPVLSPVQSVVNMNEGGLYSQPVSATDNDGTAKMVWSFEGLPSFVTFTNNNNGTGVLEFKPGYSASGEYNINVIVNDGFGAWTSRSMTLSVADQETEETVQFNFKANDVAAVGLWNSVNIASPGFSHGAILDIKNNTSTIALALTRGTVTSSSSGPNPAGNAGVYPSAVLKENMIWNFNNGSNLNDTLNIRVSGLNPAKTYDFTFHSGYNMGGDANSVTKFRIGAQEVIVNYYQNSTQTRTIAGAVPNQSGQIIITAIGDPVTNRGGVLNAMVIKGNYNDGTTPSKPLSFTGEHEEGTGVKLNWVDRAYNETGYYIYRSVNRTGAYTLLNNGATNKDATAYIDASVAPQTSYYYYVAGVNGAGVGTSSDTIKIITGNNLPVVNVQSALYVKTDAVANIDLTVTDDAGETVTVELEKKPAFVSLQNQGGVNYRIVVNPTVDNIGWYSLKLKATDDKGAVTTKDISLVVSDKNTRSVFVKFGPLGTSAPAPWNNFLNMRSTGNAMTNLKDETNATTAFAVTLMSPWSGFTSQGQSTGNNSGIYPDSVLTTGLQDTTGPRTIRISGLNNSLKYNIVLVGSMNEGGNYNVEYISGSTKDSLNGRYNARQSANLNGLSPVGGEITFTAGRITGGTVNYLNALVIEEYNPANVAILNPLYLFSEPVNRNAVDLTWSDRTVDEDVSQGYLLERATDASFLQNLTTIGLPRNTSSYRDAGLSPNTTYWYRVRAKSSGGAFSDYSNGSRVITPASIVYMSFNYTLEDAPYPWNNTFASPTIPTVFENLTNQSGAASGLSLELVRIFNGEFTAGMKTGNNSGIVPDAALASNFWLDNTQLSQFKLSGLNHARRYRIGFFGSSSPQGWFAGNYTATYTINGRTVYLNSWLNTSKVVYIDDVVPDENGELLLDFSTTEAAAWGFNAGMIIQDYNDPLATNNLVLNNPMTLANVLGIENPEDEQALNNRLAQTASGRVYPNPFEDMMSVDFTNTSVENNISADIYDISGRLQYRKNYGKLPLGSNTLKLSGSDAGLRSGVYIVTMSANGKVLQANKVIKVKN